MLIGVLVVNGDDGGYGDIMVTEGSGDGLKG